MHENWYTYMMRLDEHVNYKKWSFSHSNFSVRCQYIPDNFSKQLNSLQEKNFP